MLDALFALVLPTCLVATIYLLPFVRDPSTLPFGLDTPGYMWRASAVHEDGIMALGEERRGLGMRPGDPMVVATFMGLTGNDALTIVWMTPALLAVVIALAAGSLASDGLQEPRRRSFAYALAVGGSSFVAWTAVGYASNLMLDPIALTIVLLAVLAAFRGKGVAAGALMVVGGILMHWLLALVIVGLLTVFGLMLGLGHRFPARFRPPDRSGRRVFTMLGSGVAVAGAAFALAPELPSIVPTVDPGQKGTKKIVERLPSMALWLTLPLAALGSMAGMRERAVQRRWTAGLLGAWALLALVGVVGWYVLDLPTPPYRFAGFALAIPLLIVLAAAIAADRIRAKGGAIRGAIAVLVVIVVAGAIAASGAGVWWSQESRLQGGWFGQLETVQRYVTATDFEGQVFLTYPASRASAVRTASVRAALPRELAHRTRFEQIVLPGVGTTLAVPPDAAVLFLSLFDGRPAPPGTTLAPGVILLQGPVPPGPLEAALARTAPPPSSLVFLVLGSLALLALMGSGWTGLTGVDPVGRAVLAPSFGLAMLVVIGLLWSRSGLGFDRLGSMGLVVLVTVVGWVVDVAAGWFTRRRGVEPVEGSA